jgi:hypothetical protein
MKDHPPIIGEIAHVQHYCVRHPIIFTDTGWKLCVHPDGIDPSKIIRDAVCRNVLLPEEALRPLAEWHEDVGPVLLWALPITEPPYVGTPLDLGRAIEVTIRDAVRDYKYTEHIGGWPGYHTHWSPIPKVQP